jgi:hypothetical protein
MLSVCAANRKLPSFICDMSSFMLLLVVVATVSAIPDGGPFYEIVERSDQRPTELAQVLTMRDSDPREPLVLVCPAFSAMPFENISWTVYIGLSVFPLQPVSSSSNSLPKGIKSVSLCAFIYYLYKGIKSVSLCAFIYYVENASFFIV